MFVGHYAASLALKSVEKKSSLGILFIGVQFVDILFFPFVLLGIESVRVIENFTASTHFELVFMPYSHSLAASFLWAFAAYALFRLVFAKSHRVSLVVGLAVLSHWFFDLIVHTPDLPLLLNDTAKVGMGLWHYPIATYALEAVLLVGALMFYLRRTSHNNTFTGKYGMIIFIIVLMLVNIGNIFGPPFGDSQTTLAFSALAMYFAFAGIAFWLDRKRI